MQLKLSILDSNKALKLEGEMAPVSVLVYNDEYQDGDIIRIESDATGYCHLQLDESMLPALVYLTENVVDYHIPVIERRVTMSPKAFTGIMHLLTARAADPDEVNGRRNLALNPYDGGSNSGMFPHAVANIETRGEAYFAARNAIDGIYANAGHGAYPYGSWGINQDPNAELRLEFGETVMLDEIRLTLRADFPHDNYWTQATIEFSDGSRENFTLTKTDQPQPFAISPRKVEYLVLKELIRSDEPSPFPALTQIEAWGKPLR